MSSDKNDAFKKEKETFNDKKEEKTTKDATAKDTSSVKQTTAIKASEPSKTIQLSQVNKAEVAKDVPKEPTKEKDQLRAKEKEQEVNKEKVEAKDAFKIPEPVFLVKVKELEKSKDKPKTKESEVVIAIPEKPVKLTKPSIIITRIFGVTSSSAFGDDMFKYFLSKFQAYMSNHWSDPLIQEIVSGLRDQVKKEGISDLPQIASASQPKEIIIESINKFINTRAAINKSDPKAKAARVMFPDYMKLKSIVIRGGLHNKDIIAHVYDDVPGAFKVWSEDGKIKIHSLSSGPVDGQLDYFSNTNKGDLSKYLANGISTMNPQINSEDTGYVNFRDLSKKILNVEPSSILLLTDKVKDAQQAQKTDMNVILVAREGKLGHKSLADDKEVLADFNIVNGFTSIVFTS